MENYAKHTSEENDEFIYIYGTRAVLEVLHAGKGIEKLFIQQGLSNPLLRELKDALRLAGVIYQQVPIEKLNRMTKSNHQGVVGIISNIAYQNINELVPALFAKGEVPLLLILDRITDTRNLGAIARTAECAGVHGIIIPSRGSALINADAINTSAGALHHLPVCREDNLKATIEFLKEAGIRIIGCSEKTTQFTYDENFRQPVAIIMGSEENGVSPEYLKRADGAVKIPMIGNISSYNVSVATGMILYEVLAQRTR